jgi:hypothetical protein
MVSGELNSRERGNTDDTDGKGFTRVASEITVLIVGFVAKAEREGGQRQRERGTRMKRIGGVFTVND